MSPKETFHSINVNYPTQIGFTNFQLQYTNLYIAPRNLLAYEIYLNYPDIQCIRTLNTDLNPRYNNICKKAKSVSLVSEFKINSGS